MRAFQKKQTRCISRPGLDDKIRSRLTNGLRRLLINGSDKTLENPALEGAVLTDVEAFVNTQILSP